MTYYDMQQEKIKRLKQALRSCSMHDCSNACVFSNKHPFVCLNEMHKELVIFINQLEDKNYKLEQNLKQCENGYELELVRERYENFVLKNKIIEYENINQQLKKQVKELEEQRDRQAYIAEDLIEEKHRQTEQVREEMAREIITFIESLKVKEDGRHQWREDHNYCIDKIICKINQKFINSVEVEE